MKDAVLMISGLITGHLILLAAGGFNEPPKPEIRVPATVTRVIDGDTVEVEIRYRTHVRLLDCWAPETRTLDTTEKLRGLAAKNHLSELVSDREVLLCVPLPREGGDLGSVLTFGRILGHLYLSDAEDGRTVSEMMVEAGHATTTKEGQR